MARQQQKAAKIECHHSGNVSCVKPLHKQVKGFIEQADQLCLKRNQRFTALRKQVLLLLCESEQAAWRVCLTGFNARYRSLCRTTYGLSCAGFFTGAGFCASSCKQ